ncbi:hypothetical protein [Micromonospora sp. NPDC005324]|uniref:hypothetical protein n=1 Tax=Micromonospora sp. NPDC005324 TaxID=3157033 RepID=UPI0033B24A11
MEHPSGAVRQEFPLGGFDQERLNSKIAGLRVEGDTALYATVRAAHRELLDRYDPERINSIVVLRSRQDRRGVREAGQQLLTPPAGFEAGCTGTHDISQARTP